VAAANGGLDAIYTAPQYSALRGGLPGDPERAHWLDGDLAILRLLPRARAAVLMLPGWEQSKGARLERDWAIHLNLEVFDPPATP
jgi:hypothetical protein